MNCLLCTAETSRHLNKTLERFTYDMGSKGDEASARLALVSLFGDTTVFGGLKKAKARPSKAVEMMIGQPFLHNDE